MRKILLALFCSVSLSAPAFAAKFTPVKTMKDARLEALSADIDAVFENEMMATNFDVKSIRAFSFTRKATESDLNTIKQLNVSSFGMTADDEEGTTGAEITSGYGKDMMDALLGQFMDSFQDEDEETQMNAAYKRILGAILTRTEKLKAPALKYFMGDHSYEDGTYGVIHFLDTKNRQILSVTLGYHGT